MISVDDFLKIEEKYRLNDKQLCGVNYWTYLRFSLWNYDICSENLVLAEAHNKKKKSIKVLFILIKNYILNSFKGERHDILVLSHSRRSFNGSKYECIYTDDIMRDYYDAIFLEEPYQFEHLEPVESEKVIYNDRIIINSELRVKLFQMICRKKYAHLVNQVKQELEPAIEELKDTYNWSKSAEAIAKQAVNISLRCEYERKHYEKILEEINPKVIIEVVYYARKNMLINEIAKAKNIPVIELQHGTMYREHIAYQYLGKKEISQLPSMLFLYSDFWKKNISLPIKDKNMIVTGSVNFDKKIAQYKNCNRKDARTTLLFISQGTIGKYLSDLALSVSKLVDSKEVRIIYKLHPAEYTSWKKELSGLKDSEIEVIDHSNVNLFELFSQCDYQIGAYSTALFEGMGFGLKTLIYNVGHYDIMIPLIEQGYACLVTSETEVLKAIQSTAVCENNTNFFWMKNALNNIRAEIDKLI